MNKQELDNALAFINSPSGELQIIIYANVIGTNEPRKLNINEEDLIGLRQLFVSSLRQFGIRKCPKKLVISLLFCNFIVENQ